MNYPLNLTFRITTISNDFTIQDANGENLAFVRQKLLKLKEQVDVYKDQTRSELKYKIKADRWLDFTASYSFFDEMQKDLGRVVRRGWKSIWKAHYEIYDENDAQEFLVQEKNPWTKVFDGLLSEIPFVGFFSGYFFNPSYTVQRPDGTVVAELVKQKSFFGRRFTIEKVGSFDAQEEVRIMLGLMMMILLERQRG